MQFFFEHMQGTFNFNSAFMKVNLQCSTRSPEFQQRQINTLLEDEFFNANNFLIGLQKEVQPITVIPEVVLGFLQLTIEVVS